MSGAFEPESEKPEKPKKKAPRRAKAERPAGPINLRWDLAELPSSQHKSGLAGLALCVDYLRRSNRQKGICEVTALDGSGLSLRVDRDGMQSLFDCIYAASSEEQERNNKRQKKKADGTKVDDEPKAVRDKQVVDKKGNEKTKTVYIYDQTVPHGALVDEWDDSPTKIWRKLWRDVVWTTLRGVPATREPYDARAENREVHDGTEAWEELASAPRDGVELPSTYYLGAQAKSAENVSFRDVSRYRFLLHFWQFVAPIYVPAVVDREGKRDFVGYVIAVPEVAELDAFVERWDRVVRSRGPEISGYVPRDAVVDVAGEAGLDVARRTFDVIATGKVDAKPWIRAVDLFHIEKDGNNVRTRGVARVDLQRNRANEYGRARSSYWSPLFRRQRIINILEGDAWWAGFGRLCAVTPQGNTFDDDKFRRDCRSAFKEVEMNVDAAEAPPTLEHLVYQVIRNYVYGRLEGKYQLSWDEVKGRGEDRQKDYNDKKLKIAREAFLAVRARTGADFVGYFTGTLCSIPRRLDEGRYLMLARALHDPREVERVRSLALLALSAA